MSNRLTEQERILFDKLVEKRIIQALVMDDPSMGGLMKGSSDIYPDPAHFVYELLQNADDARATKASFYLYKDCLIFIHNGERQFTITEDGELGQKVKPDPYGDINSITAYSSSKENEPNTIGKFGLGFKSVYIYTDRPEIYDDKFWFAIENRMVPVLLDQDHELRKPGETLFVLPYKRKDISVKQISDKLKSLQAPTLFLQSLNMVYFYDEVAGREYNYVKDVSVSKQIGDITYEYVNIDDHDVTSQLLLFHCYSTIGKSQKLKVSVGYFFDRLGEIDTSKTRGIHCFFPTKESFGLCFISHAPFLLTNNRREITEDDINKKLIEDICLLAADALVIIRDYHANDKQLLTDNLYSILPYKDYKQNLIHYTFAPELTSRIHFLNAVKKVMMKESLLYTVNKEYVTIDRACFLTKNKLQPLLKTEQIRELRKNKKIELLKIDEDQELRFFLERFLGIASYSPEKLARDITAAFMKRQGVDWAIRLYKYLKDEDHLLWKKESYGKNLLFRYAPIFLSQKNSWIPAFKDVSGEEQPNIYLPIGKSRGKYNTVHSSILEKADKTVRLFFEELGINTPDILDYIKKHIIPKYHEFDDRIEVEHEDLVADVHTLLAIINDEDYSRYKDEIINLLHDKLYLHASDERYHLPDALYLKTDFLCKYFQGNKDVAFLDFNLYLGNDNDVSKEELNDFFVSIGVNTYPRIMQSEFHNIYDFNEQRCTEVEFHRSTRGYEIKDYYLDGILHFYTKTLNQNTSKSLWKILPQINLKDFENGSYRCHYYGYYNVKFESQLIDDLKHLEWLFNASGEQCSAEDITQEEMISVGYENNEILFDLLGIKTQTKSITELGGTEEQQRQQELGDLVERYGVSKEKLVEILEQYKAEELKQRGRNSSYPNNGYREPSNSGGSTVETYGSTSGNESSDLSELYGDTKLRQPKSTSREGSNDSDSNQRRIEDLIRRLDDDKEKKLKKEELKQEVEDIPKYTKEWFKKKLQLEYWDTCDSDSNSSTKRSISVSFSKIVIDRNNNRLYELRNPSRDIPVWVEEIENLTVKFLFNDREEMPCSFEVANVRDFSLRLKAKASDSESLSSIDWTKLTQATIDINNPTNLVDNFRRAFNELILPDGYNLKENLRNNISFVFGPPGTGKTTFVAKHIIDYINSKRTYARILVLAPTNKACDVLVKKIMEADDSYSWLGRFVTTGDPEIEDNGLVCDRNSELFRENKCCIVTTMARLPYDGFQTEDGYHYLRDIDWNLVICDEASMLPIAQITYAIYKFKDVPFLIAGDPMQIAPIDVTDNWKSENIYDMVNLKSFENPTTEPIQFKITNLETQYRAILSIGHLFSDFAYEGRLKHHWKDSDQRLLNIPELPLKSVTYIPFKVESYDSMFGAKKLSRSPIHIYSALLATELSKFIAKKYAERNPNEEDLDVGIICPYASQAQLIEKMLEQVENLPEGVKITTGTIHSFQGDQCNIVIALFNPPVGLRYGASNIHLNKLNIINVAISRAKDYLIVFLPDKQNCQGYEYLEKINQLVSISSRKYEKVTSVIPATTVEKIVFGKAHYLESNTFVTSHQLANVYTKPTCLYEIRVDENSVDIQIGS